MVFGGPGVILFFGRGLRRRFVFVLGIGYRERENKITVILSLQWNSAYAIATNRGSNEANESRDYLLPFGCSTDHCDNGVDFWHFLRSNYHRENDIGRAPEADCFVRNRNNRIQFTCIPKLIPMPEGLELLFPLPRCLNSAPRQSGRLLC